MKAECTVSVRLADMVLGTKDVFIVSVDVVRCIVIMLAVGACIVGDCGVNVWAYSIVDPGVVVDLEKVICVKSSKDFVDSVLVLIIFWDIEDFTNSVLLFVK